MKSIEILLLSQKDVISLDLQPREVKAAVEQAMIEHSNGTYEMHPKIGVHPTGTDPDNFIHAMPAYLKQLGACGLKWVGGFAKNPQHDLPNVTGIQVCNDVGTGVPLAVMDCAYLTGLVQGSLRDQLRYPGHGRDGDDEEIRKIVEMANLSDVLARVDDNLDSVIDWVNVMSLGEQQRVAFARLFLRRPKLAFLDEATSALDEENQRRIYELIRQSRIGFISVGHRETLVQFHDQLLKLKGAGEWELTKKTAGT